ncbi:MAG: coproporphyrinogen III oxidase family protein [DPANN group archaeon]|nr:coproporphyrinogen III oxidase family protein [DPANN group archaeon]
MYDLNKFDEIEDCIRWYPCNISKIDQEVVFGPKTVSLYVHIPFCRGGCFFCPFNRYIYDDKVVDEYLGALELEIKLINKRVNIKNLKISTIWIGGGTPSDLLPEQIDRIFTILEDNFNYKNIEIIFEGIADGSSFNSEKVKILKKHKVNKISLGVQSLNEHYVRNILKRRHHALDAKKTISFLKSKFFINTDFMYYLPGQNIADLEKDILEITSTNINHITFFPFMEIENTPIPGLIKKGKLPKKAGKKTYFAMYKKLLSIMHSKGYYEYTPYHFAKKGKEIQYNINRWGFPQKDILGLGAGAFSFFNETSYTNVHLVDEYIKCVKKNKIPILAGKRANDLEKITRCIVLGSKLFEINKTKFNEITGIDIDKYFKNEIKDLVKKGLIINLKNKFKLTTFGKAFSNEVSKTFYTKENKGFRQPVGADFRRR